MQLMDAIEYDDAFDELRRALTRRASTSSA
jgi:hypothetical protein